MTRSSRAPSGSSRRAGRTRRSSPRSPRRRGAEPPADAGARRACSAPSRSSRWAATPRRSALARAARGAADEAVRRGALLVLARAAARAGRLEEASRRYEEVAALARRSPGSRSAGSATSATRRPTSPPGSSTTPGDFARGAEALDAFARANPRSRRVDDARWFAAWSRYRLGRGAEAARAFARLARGRATRTPPRTGARGSRGAPAAQRALYRAAIRAGGDGWYALLARARLAALGETARAPPAARRASAPGGRTIPGRGARSRSRSSCSALGPAHGGARRARAISRGPRASGPRRPPSRSSPRSRATPRSRSAWRATTSRRTRRTLRWVAPGALPRAPPCARRAAFGVDPALVLAVMRRESSFRPGGRGAAPARRGSCSSAPRRPSGSRRVAGLPGRPRGAPARAGGEHRARRPLPRAARRAVRRSRALALAAYNAGPAPVAEWARARAGMPLDAWVESIPFRETRGYVKIVLSDWDALPRARRRARRRRSIPAAPSPRPSTASRSDGGPARRGGSAPLRALAPRARAHRVEDVVAEPPRTEGVTPGIRRELVRVARPPPGDLEHRLLAEDLERRPVERARPLLARDPERAQHRAARPRRGRARPAAGGNPPDRRRARAARPRRSARTRARACVERARAASSRGEHVVEPSRKCVSSAA